MKVRTNLLWVAFAAIFFTACKQTDFKKTKDGFPYKVFSDGKGEKILPGYIVSYHSTLKIKDSVLRTTYGTPPQFAPIPKDSGASNPLSTILLEARNGDSIQINQPVDSLVKKSPQLAQDPLLAKKRGQDLVTIIKVTGVYKTEDEAQAAFEKQNIQAFGQQPGVAEQRKKDVAAINDYLKANNIQVQQTPWGAYVQVINPGSGPKPKYGQFSLVKYTGKDFTGKVFDTNNKPGSEPYPVQIGAGGSIIGFEDAIRQMSKGEKANVYIPSVLGYGTQGSPPNIQPNQNLWFEIEVVDIANQRPMPAMPRPTAMPDSSRK